MPHLLPLKRQATLPAQKAPTPLPAQTAPMPSSVPIAAGPMISVAPVPTTKPGAASPKKEPKSESSPTTPQSPAGTSPGRMSLPKPVSSLPKPVKCLANPSTSTPKEGIPKQVSPKPEAHLPKPVSANQETNAFAKNDSKDEDALFDTTTLPKIQGFLDKCRDETFVGKCGS